MILRNVLIQNKLHLSDKGMLCLVKATLDTFPILLLAFEDYDTITNGQLIDCVLGLDLKDEQIAELLSSFERYAKLWCFS